MYIFSIWVSISKYDDIQHKRSYEFLTISEKTENQYVIIECVQNLMKQGNSSVYRDMCRSQKFQLLKIVSQVLWPKVGF